MQQVTLLCTYYDLSTLTSFLPPGNVYVSEYSNNRIRKITVSTGIITTIAGSSTSGRYSGDNGAATSATLYGPSGIGLDASGEKFLIFCYLLLFTLPSSYRQRIHR